MPRAIMFVDDAPEAVITPILVLREEGYCVDAVHTIKKAYERLNESEYAVIFLDLAGTGAYNEIREFVRLARETARICIFSGPDRINEIYEIAASLGVHDFLYKGSRGNLQRIIEIVEETVPI